MCASQYSSLKVTPVMSQPSVQSVTDQPGIEIAAHRMLRGAGHGPGLDVAGDVGLDEQPAVANIVAQHRILVQPGAVADPVGVAAVHRLGDRRRAGRLARVDRDPEAAVGRDVERRLVHARRPARLAARQVERDDPAVAIRHRQPRDRQRHLGGVVPERAVDDPGDDPEIPLAHAPGPRSSASSAASIVSPPRVLSLGQ